MSGVPLFLLRHGEPEGAGRLLGRTDAAPTAAGIAACLRRTEGLAAERLVCSDRHRAHAAAEAIATARGLSIVVDPRWREIDFGDWDGLRADEIDRAALARFHADPDGAAPPGGEQWSALVARVAAAVAALVPVPTIVVTHGGAMRAALAALCGFSAAQGFAFDLPYAARLDLHVWHGDPAAARIVGLAT